MSITFIGPAGSCEFPWIQYALSADNVLHHLEHMKVTDVFRELHRVGEALGGRTVIASAMRLREELSQAQALCLMPVDRLAISAQTKAVLSMPTDPELGTPTEIVGPRLRLPWTVAEPRSLGDIFGNLVTGLLEITRGAKESDTVEVIDG